MTLRAHIRRFDESGQTIVITALCMVILAGFLGIAIDIGSLRYQKRNLQAAADAAALAAGMEIRVCGTTPNCQAMQDAAANALTENGFTGATLTTNCGSGGGNLTIQVNSPSCASASDPNKGKNGYAEVVVSQTAKTYFARIFGVTNLTLSARAEAARNPTAPCIYALDPTKDGALSLLIGLGVQANCGIVVESSSKNAVQCLIGLGISAPRINVTGGTSGLLCTSTPLAKTNIPVPDPADPMAYLPAPSNANAPCGASTHSPYTGSATQAQVSLIQPTVFNPGVYCGGISVTGALLSNITFNPGTYILRDGKGGLLNLFTTGGLSITLTALSSVNGNGVTFYNEGPSNGMTITLPAALGLSGFNLSAPTTGEYGGVLVFQAHGVTAPGNFVASLLQGSNFEGAIYEPDAQVTYAVNAISAAYNILVAKDISFGAVGLLSTFGNKYDALSTGSPLNGDDAVLIQ